MEKSIQEWCIKNANIINIADFNPISGVHYDLQFSPSLDKVEIRCSCGLSFTLLLCNSGNFKVKHLLEHLLYRKMFLSSR